MKERLPPGDRGYGGVIEIESFRNGKVRYKQMFNPDDIMIKLYGHSVSQSYSPNFYSGIFIVYEMDLAKEPVNKDYRSEMARLAVEKEYIGLHSEGPEGFSKCFYGEIDKMLKRYYDGISRK